MAITSERCFLQLVLIVLAAQWLTFEVGAFFIGGHPSIRHPSPTALSAAANQKSKKNQKTKKAKRAAKTNVSMYKGPKKDRSSARSTPPWQVLNKKEMKLHAEQEKTRRSNLKLGIETESVSTRKTLSTAFLNDAATKFLKWRRFNPVTVPAGQRFVGAYLDKQLPPRLGIPEVAFLGRSNVGKSSLLNRLSCRDQARVGKTPGATASVNLYALLDKKDREILGWADLPGFGYAKLSKEVKESVQMAAETYLGKRKELALGILLVDIRRTPSDDDRAVLAALFDMGLPIVVVATKMDKVSNNERGLRLLDIQQGLGLPDGQPLCVSSVTGEGSRDLWRIILEACETCVREFKSKYDEDTDTKSHDEELGELSEFDDPDDFVYEQGYDWIHGSPITVEEEYLETKDDEDSDFDDDRSAPYPASPEPQKETLKELRKRVREMEKRGEI